MNNRWHSDKASDIRAEACGWIAQLETSDLTRADVESFREWLQRSPQHAAQVRELARVSADLNVLTGMAEPLRVAADHYDSVMHGRYHRRRRFPRLARVTGVSILGLVAVWFSLSQYMATSLTHEAVFATVTGEHREYELPDGSTIALNTDSQVKVRYSADERLVWLVGGEAMFDVVSDADRPFFVRVGTTVVEAIGTAFLVRFEPNSLNITVTEGSVRVADLTGSAKGSVIEPDNDEYEARPQIVTEAPTNAIVLGAGHTLYLPAGGSVAIPELAVIEEFSERQMQRKLAWQEGLLDFSETALEEVVREVGRHTTLKIEIADPTLRDLKFGGVFRTGDTDPLFLALEVSYGIQAEYIDNKTVRLSRPHRD